MADYESFIKAVDIGKRVFAIDDLKEEQLKSLYNFVCRRDVFVNLPTGFGKSLIYQMAPIIVKELNICDSPIIIVVSPLVTLMQDQVTQLTEKGISAISLSEVVLNDDKLKSGCYTFVYSSPESLLNNEQIRELIGTCVYKQHVFGIVVDEAHCISHWGYGRHGQEGRNAFRKWFSHIQEIRSLVQSNTPIMALTATAVKKTRDIILKSLGMKNPIIVAVSPNRTNICFCVKILNKNMPLLSYFQWLLNTIKELKTQADRVIIFCQTIRQCHKLYSILLDSLDSINVLNHNQKLIEMLHSNTPARVKDRIVESMSNVDGIVRVLVCTIAFGMGINCKGVKTVIHLGPSRNVESYMQESGRCGRHGIQSKAVIYYLGRMLTHVDKRMKEYVKLQADGTTCRREWLLNHFDIEKAEKNKALPVIIKHNCCDLCAKHCACGANDCPRNVTPMPAETSQKQSTRKRQISIEQKQELTKKLIMLRKELNMPIFEQFICHNGQIHTPELPIYFNQFGTFQINQVLHAANHLFSIEDINNNVEIWKHDHAVKVYNILHDIFKDVEPMTEDDIKLAAQGDIYDEDSDEQEWHDFMDDDNIPNFSTSNMDISSFDCDMDSMHVEYDDFFPLAVEDALHKV